ncbi:hypothetical protein GUJ93_ZPchr0011g28771 [Zizania palustris]|uniref:Uncharacterized protein n=1 Tax=Zizania palustris TaxID=103762 RepID=A0A8J5WIX1_ZIZPA|nr:hypothetical protein GUJ93_ZPchr0011g28771 [Zizania palustris]
MESSSRISASRTAARLSCSASCDGVRYAPGRLGVRRLGVRRACGQAAGALGAWAAGRECEAASGAGRPRLGVPRECERLPLAARAAGFRRPPRLATCGVADLRACGARAETESGAD